MTLGIRSAIYAAAGLAALAAAGLIMSGGGGSPAQADAPVSTAPSVVAGPGRVEPRSEEVQVNAQVSGTLRQVTPDEGDRVSRGQVIAVIENADYRARVASAEAEVRVREAEARKIRNGARSQERAEAAAAVREAEAVLANARADHARRRGLYADKLISREDMERADQQLGVAEARLDVLRHRHALIDADAREEDLARAASDVALARARLDEARAMYEKTFVRAPIDGIVIRRHRKGGETVSTQFDSPIVTLADPSVLRVRVDVDEAEIGGIAVGQRAYVTADAFGDRRFPGRVIRIGRVLGKKNVRTDEPTERVDQKILETLIELEGGHELPIGLRVQAFITK